MMKCGTKTRQLLTVSLSLVVARALWTQHGWFETGWNGWNAFVASSHQADNSWRPAASDRRYHSMVWPIISFFPPFLLLCSLSITLVPFNGLSNKLLWSHLAAIEHSRVLLSIPVGAMYKRCDGMSHDNELLTQTSVELSWKSKST